MREGTQEGCELVRGGNVHSVQEERFINRSASISTHEPYGTHQPYYRLGECQASHEGGLDHLRDQGVYIR